MSTSQSRRYVRHATRHRGLSYRVRADGSRTYAGYIGGRQVPVGTNEKDALAKYSELRSKAARGEPVAPTRLTFGEVSLQWYESKERRLRPWTLKGYRASLDNVLLPEWGTWKLGQISTQHVAGLIRDLEAKGLAASYISSHLKPLSGVFRFAMSRRMVSVNPVDLLTVDERARRTPRKVYEWSPDSIDSLLAVAGSYAPILTFAIRTGMRQGEILGLRWQDVDLTGDTPALNVVHQWSRMKELAPLKSPAALRRIPLSPSMVKFLLGHKISSPFSQDEDFVFASASGEPLSHRRVQHGFERAAEKAGIEGTTFHSTRHAFASQMISAGVSPIVLADLLGHSSSAITLGIYAHLFDRTRTDDQVRAAMEGAISGQVVR